MKNKPVTLKNIADDLKISITTVSFVLNGKSKEKNISEQLTAKVLDYAKKINYKPNQLAQSLRTGKSNILVFMVEDISNSFFCKLARIFEDFIYKEGYRVIFCSNDNDDEKSRELIDLFTYRQVDGFIIVPSPGIRSTIENLIKQNIPVILLDRYFEELECNVVTINNKQASFDATAHLIGNGFKNIGFITTDSNQSQMQDRLSGYRKAISYFGLNSTILSIPYNEMQQDKGQVKQFLSENTALDAVFFATNYLAQRGLEVLKEDNYSLIDRIGIISFDDHEMFNIYPITITCISQPMEKICSKLMEIMLVLLNSKDVLESTNKCILKSELIIRESTVKRFVKNTKDSFLFNKVL
ncbi:LacI family transcriptional regulator [Flavobacterium cupreum]|uniref:LacI family transcriptional regulator n=2 Tax=Flavobacterium TaxID=237 RepID=A0A4Y7UD92_9FLAO|nr:MULTISPECIES: LacI family DNA-binding transcriptional regulator [Flavobacterium]RUT67993.1 LacI family transcriptional regulator [Flavobacterium cupreum]TCN59019.1 LacI family transcriptional regulator [Flavobacterium circumlabens]TEB44420.1 LacI family transcriptional regulator [Flavobacterium circumlabens]